MLNLFRPVVQSITTPVIRKLTDELTQIDVEAASGGGGGGEDDPEDFTTTFMNQGQF